MRTSQRSVASAVSRTCTDGVDGRQAEPALDVSRETSDRYPCSPGGWAVGPAESGVSGERVPHRDF